MTDASDRGIGAVLMQEQDNSKMAIVYASRKLKGSELALQLLPMSVSNAASRKKSTRNDNVMICFSYKVRCRPTSVSLSQYYL
jgi:hypothetical protein